MRGPPKGKKRIRAQATTELAVFAALFFIALGAMMNIGQGIQHQMDAEVDAYLMALEKTRLDQDPVSYTVLRDKRLAGTGDSFKEPQAASFSGSSTVLWAKLLPEPDTDPQVYYKLNSDTEIDMRQEAWKKDLPGVDDDDDGDIDSADTGENPDGSTGEYTYPSIWEIETTTHSGYNGRTDINEDSNRRIESDSAVSTREITRNFKMRYYNRKSGYSEDVEGLLPAQVQGLAPASVGSSVVRPSWQIDIVNGIDDDRDGLVDEDGPGAAYREYETYKAGASGVKWERTRTTDK